jgi:hypothetical protein
MRERERSPLAWVDDDDVVGRPGTTADEARERARKACAHS